MKPDKKEQEHQMMGEAVAWLLNDATAWALLEGLRRRFLARDEIFAREAEQMINAKRGTLGTAATPDGPDLNDPPPPHDGSDVANSAWVAWDRRQMAKRAAWKEELEREHQQCIQETERATMETPDGPSITKGRLWRLEREAQSISQKGGGTILVDAKELTVLFEKIKALESQGQEGYLPDHVGKWAAAVRAKLAGHPEAKIGDALSSCSFCGHPRCEHGSGPCRHPWEGPGPYCKCLGFIP